MFHALQTTDVALVGGAVSGHKPFTGTLTVSQQGEAAQLNIINGMFYNISHYDADCVQSDTVINFFMADSAQIRSFGAWDPKQMYNEHEDFFIKLKLAGYKVLSCKDVQLRHNAVKTYHVKGVKSRRYLTQFLNKRGLAVYVMCGKSQSVCQGEYCKCATGWTFVNQENNNLLP